MQDHTAPETSDDGTENHPAFGMISIHRITAMPGAVLFQSDIRHQEYIRLEVHEASRKREIKYDLVHPGKTVLEISMSMSQFSSFVASAGTEGVPCTIGFTGSGENAPGERPGLRPASRLSKTRADVRGAAQEAYSHIQEAFGKYEETLSLSGKGSAAARHNAIRKLRAVISNAAENVSYASAMLDEHTEAVVEQARGDIEAMAFRAAERMGIPPVKILAIGE